MLLHASCVAITNQGVLITGSAGAGKSDLALRLIDEGAHLVSDDQTTLHIDDGVLKASPPTTIAGLFEIRHVGLVRMPYVTNIPVVLHIALTSINEPLERLPEAETLFLLDQPVRSLRLSAFAASTPAKIRAALTYPLVTDTL